MCDRQILVHPCTEQGVVGFFNGDIFKHLHDHIKINLIGSVFSDTDCYFSAILDGGIGPWSCPDAFIVNDHLVICFLLNVLSEGNDLPSV